VVEESVGLLLARELMAHGQRVLAYDPAENEPLFRAACHPVPLASTATECIAQSAVVVLATPWPEFRTISAEQWGGAGRSRTIIDCWRVLVDLRFGEGVTYLALGTAAVGQSSRQERMAPKTRGS
jgi:UDPglucose 6-dehydrogenase